MRALVKLKPGTENTILDVPIPEIGADEILIRVKACAICGSDIHKFIWDPSMHMYEKYLPLIFGHEFSGVVEKVGADIKPDEAKPGDRVTINNVHVCGVCEACRKGMMTMCPEFYWNGGTKDGAFAEFTVVKKDQILHMPDDMSFIQGSLIEPLGVAANAVEKLGVRLGDRVAVIGAGTIGLFTVLMAKAAGAAYVTSIGLPSDVERLKLAVAELGGDDYIINEGQNAEDTVKKLTGGLGMDVVFECSGAAPMVNLALSLVKVTGKVGVVGIYAKNLELDLSTMVRSQKGLIGTFGGTTPYSRTFQWAKGHPELLAKAEKIVTHKSRIEDIEAALKRSADHESIKEVFVFD
ncbi:MAG: alcohol dehydrogenase catalytic domain-containing protein [Clostridiales Family XIII bacterium]|jgi:threonine dehydrogenase-like Zn-dependent dehydrogenase|nr:alcohol dehydrogenase catalytic domain-containing protein [Clostridiales Family XIII bacterium]